MLEQLTIVIPTLNEERYLPLLLSDLVKQKFTGKLQVIVVDGNSEDRTVMVVNSFKDKLSDLLVIESKRGVSVQRNAGAARAKYDHIAFIDADIRLPHDFLNRLAPKVPAESEFVGTVFHWIQGENVIDHLVVGGMYIMVLFLLMVRSPLSPGPFTLVTKKTHQKIGGYMEGVILGEDIDYGRRAKKSGAAYRFFFGPTVYHSPRRVRQMGRVALLWLWFRGFMYTMRYGAIKDTSKFKYPSGHYDK